MEALDFGKHRGKTFEEVPLTYVIWLAGFELEGTNRVVVNSSAYNHVRLHKHRYIDQAHAFLKGRCWHCGGMLDPKKIPKVKGVARSDWIFHKECWRQIRREEGEDPPVGGAGRVP